MANSNKIFMWATLKSLIGIATEDNSVSSPNTKKVINYLLLAAVAVKNVAFLRNVSDYNPLRHRNNFNLKTVGTCIHVQYITYLVGKYFCFLYLTNIKASEFQR